MVKMGNPVRLFFVKHCSTLMAAASVLALSAPAHAQESTAPLPPADAQNSSVEDIVVTARKRVENLQNTPISITAFSAAGLEARQVQQVSSIAALTPNLTFETTTPISSSSGAAVVYIRGIGQIEAIPTVDLGVGTYVDGVYLARSVGGVVDLLDIERLEVLRGPQGTLFGRNTIGGAINITTKKPAPEFGGDASILYGTANHVIARANLNVPITKNLFTKLSASYDRQDGYVHRTDGRDTGNKNRLSGRFAVRWLPTTNVTVDFTVDGTRDRTNGAPFVLVATKASGLYPQNADGTSTSFPAESKAAVFPFYSNVVLNGASCAGAAAPVTNPPALAQCFGDHYISANRNSDQSNRRLFSNLDLWGTSLDIGWDLGGAQLRSISAYRKISSAYNVDQDHTPIDISSVDSVNNQHQFSQEIQLLGKIFDNRLSYIIGAFYFNERARTIEEIVFPIASFHSGGLVKNDSVALFTQETFNITRRLSLTAGIRYTRDHKAFTPDQFIRSSTIGIAAGTAILPSVEARQTFQKWTPMANLSYKVTDNALLYLNYSEGFKSGGFTQRVFPPITPASGQNPADVIPSFKPESAQVYEAGFKTDLFNRRLRINGALFNTEYKDVQVTVQNVTVAPVILNAARARIRGAELEITAVPVTGLRLEGGLGYIDAKYLETAPGSQITTDDKFAKTPKWSINGAVSYEQRLNDNWMLTPRVDWSYRSLVYNDAINSPEIAQPGYSLFDGGISIENKAVGWLIVARVRNIGNKHYITAGYSDNINLGLSEAVFDRGREWSLSVKRRF